MCSLYSERTRLVRAVLFFGLAARVASQTSQPEDALLCNKAWLTWEDDKGYNCNDYEEEGWCVKGNVTKQYDTDVVDTNGYTGKDLCPACTGCTPAEGDEIETQDGFWNLKKSLALIISVYLVLQAILVFLFWKFVWKRKTKNRKTSDQKITVTPPDCSVPAVGGEPVNSSVFKTLQPYKPGKMGASYVQHCQINEKSVQPGKTLGLGAFGRVYLGKHKETGTLVAVKEIMMQHVNDADLDDAKSNPEFSEMMNELAVLQMVDHPNIVPYLAHEFVREAPKKLLIFLAYLPGGTVKSQLEDYGAYSYELVQKYSRQLVIAIEYLHSFDPPVIHRDLKTANMLLTMSGDIKIADFGCAKVRKLADANSATQTVKGTMPYMAPEAYSGKDVSPSHDIWSLGCCVLEMCTAKPPWHGKQIGSILDAFRLIAMSVDVPEPPVGCPKIVLNFLYEHCLVRDPKTRADAKTLQRHEFVTTKDLDFTSDTFAVNRVQRGSSASSTKMAKAAGGGCDVSKSCPVGPVAKSGSAGTKKERKKKTSHGLTDLGNSAKTAPGISPRRGKSPPTSPSNTSATQKKRGSRVRAQSRRRSSKHSCNKAEADKLTASDKTRPMRTRTASRRKKDRPLMPPDVELLPLE